MLYAIANDSLVAGSLVSISIPTSQVTTIYSGFTGFQNSGIAAVADVPEPATFGSLTAALALLAGYRRFTNKGKTK